MPSLNIPFPSAGVFRRAAYYAVPSEPPFPTPWAVNVRLEDSLTNRLRGGSWERLEIAELPNDRPLYLVDQDGKNITDDDGNLFIVESEKSVASSGGRVWAVPGVGAPASHPAEVVYRGRLIRPEGAAIYASRQGNYSDWNYGAYFEDPGRAFAIQLSEAGEIGDSVLALVPHKDAFLLAATSDSLWVMQGDPTAEGTMRNVARGVGMLSARAWCKDHLDRVYFLSSRGFYTVAASGEGLQPISEDLIPEELTAVEDEDVVLQYNHADRGVYIHLPSAEVSWFYDTERRQFWPFTNLSEPSHLLLGPIGLGPAGATGIITAIHGVIAAGSEDVTWRIIIGDTAEEAAENGKLAITADMASVSAAQYVKYSGTWKPGRSTTARPRVRGNWCVLWLSSVGEWAYEKVAIQYAPIGEWRG